MFYPLPSFQNDIDIIDYIKNDISNIQNDHWTKMSQIPDDDDCNGMMIGLIFPVYVSAWVWVSRERNPFVLFCFPFGDY